MLSLPDFIALLDAARALDTAIRVGPIIERIERALEPDEEAGDLDELIRRYDAIHGAG